MTSPIQDPLGVRGDAQFVTERSDHVTLDSGAVAAYAPVLARESQSLASEWEADHHFAGEDERTIAYVFVLDTVNFCFWGDPKWRRRYQDNWLDGYWALAAALTEEATKNAEFLDPHNLAALDAETLNAVLGGEPTIPLLEERATNLRALGRCVVDRFEGRFSHVVQEANLDAVELVRLLVGGLASFRDEAIYQGRKVGFYKRAQILAADLHGAAGGRRPQRRWWGELARMHELTAFADYKLPQILRHQGILRYSAPLAEKVDNQVPLPAGSNEEVEIRANTVWAVELLRQEMQALGLDLPSYRIDWLLWSASQESAQMRPYHRTLTIYY
jgi:hypothetical protein